MINNPLINSEEDIVMEGEEDEESRASAAEVVVVMRAAENGVNRESRIDREMTSVTAVRSDITKNAGVGRGAPSPILNRENGLDSKRRSVTTVRSDVTRNAGGGRSATFPFPPVNNFQIYTPRSRTNTATSAISDVMQFLLIRAETDAQQ